MALIDRIKFAGLASRDWMIYKFPGEEFVTTSQLIVGEGQVAVFVKGGQACDCFAAGTHTLSTPNIPILKGLINLPFGGKTPFTAEIYFINTTTKLDLNWGTVDPIQVIDPKYAIKLRVRGFGQVGLRIADPRQFLTQLIGTLGDYNIVSYDKVLNFFRGMLMVKIKTIIADAIVNKDISALEISAKLDEISAFGKQSIEKEYRRFGIEVVNFFVSSINFPDEDFAAINKILEDRAAFELMGDGRYTSKRSFDVMQTLAGNEGTAGGAAGAGLGLGMGLAAANNVAANMGGLAAGINTRAAAPAPVPEPAPTPAPIAAPGPLCAGCGKPLLAGARFCHECGQPVKTAAECPGCKAEVDANQKFCHSCGCQIG